MTSSIYPLTISVNDAGTITAVAVVGGGSGYTDLETVTYTGQTSGATNASGIASVTAGAITSVTIAVGGSGYTNGETVNILGNGTGATGTVTATTIAADTDILSSDIDITNDMVKPGGGGILRLYMSLVFDATPGDITVTNNGVEKGALNADNDRQLITDGYYRFDVDVESGDAINLILTGSQTAATITTINFIRAHLVQFGA